MIIRTFNVRKISHYLNITDPFINPSIDIFSLIFYLVMKRLIVTKNSVVEIQNPVVNHESQPVKLNLDRFSRLLQTKNLIYSPISQTFREMNNPIHMLLLLDGSSFTEFAKNFLNATCPKNTQ